MKVRAAGGRAILSRLFSRRGAIHAMEPDSSDRRVRAEGRRGAGPGGVDEKRGVIVIDSTDGECTGKMRLTPMPLETFSLVRR
jgi:hypothetical protein